MVTIKGTSRRVWLTDEDLQRLKEITEFTHMGQTELLTHIIRAGLHKIASEDKRIVLPFEFDGKPVHDGMTAAGTLKTSKKRKKRRGTSEPA
jgi:hypothetical protein